MSEQKNTNKRKLLTRYLILAACILVIAAITVTTVFAVNDWFRSDITIDNTQTGNQTEKPADDKNKPDDGNNNKPDDDKSKPDDNNGNGNNNEGNGDDKPASSATAFVAPVAEMNVTNGYEFGKDVTLGYWHFHTGLDMSAEEGTEVFACQDGTVEKIVLGDELDGNTITLVHRDGVKSVYSFIDVKEGIIQGMTVKRGDVIGTVASPVGKEFKQGAHLHFEMYKDGKTADPADYLDIVEK